MHEFWGDTTQAVYMHRSLTFYIYITYLVHITIVWDKIRFLKHLELICAICKMCIFNI